MNAPHNPSLTEGAEAAHWSVAADPSSFFGGWLAEQCRALPGVRAGQLLLGEPDVGPYELQASWPPGDEAGAALAAAAQQAITSRSAMVLPLPGGGHAAALPVAIDGHLLGVVALANAGDATQAQALLPQLAWGLSWVETWFRRQGTDPAAAGGERLAEAFDQVAAVLDEQGFGDAARTLVTGLALQLACDRVSLGVLRRGQVRVLALSHSATLGPRSNLSRAVALCMEEAIDQKAAVRLPVQPGDEIVVTREHARLAAEHGSGSILTLPLAAGRDFVAALTFERPGDQPFSDDDLALCRTTGAVAARLLALQRRAERAWWLRAGDAVGVQARRLLGPRHVKRKLALLVAAGAVAFFALVNGDYRVTAPATLEGAVRRVVAAPFDGFVASAQVRAGDVTQAKAVMAVLDDRDLKLERMKWSAQAAQYRRQQFEAEARRDRARTQVSQALAAQAYAQVSLLDEQIARATVRAPFDGLVVKGDLSQSLGSAVRRGDVLFEVTPLREYRVIVEVDERDITEIAVGQTGRLVLASITGEPWAFQVSKITPVTTARDGRNFFRVEGLLERAGERLRPGMAGVAKIEVDQRRLIWIWTHRLVHWARLFAFNHLP